jgi:hypothetical protein
LLRGEGGVVGDLNQGSHRSVGRSVPGGGTWVGPAGDSSPDRAKS